MRILICRPNSYIASELTEYFRGCNWEADIASEPKAIYQALSRQKYDATLFYVSSLEDFALIRYINATYPELQVVISSDSAFAASIENIRAGAFTALKAPYPLKQLQELFAQEYIEPLPCTGEGMNNQTKTNQKNQKRWIK